MAGKTLGAAGGVVYRNDPDSGHQFLIVHRPRYRDWSLPKGKLDRGESFPDAALREIEEETGYKCSQRDYLGAVTYHTQRGRLKVVRYWLVKAKKGEFKPNSEVDTVEWVGINAARALLTYNRDVRLVERAHAILSNPTATRIYLVRHGNAGVRARWKGPDKKRPLTEKGLLQAAGVGEIMSRHPVTEIRSSPALRCIQTVETVAADIGVDIESTKLLSEFTPVDTIYEYLSDFDGGAVVLCSHKDWIGPLLHDLDGRGVPIRGARKWPKASIWVLDLLNGKAVTGHYEGRG